MESNFLSSPTSNLENVLNRACRPTLFRACVGIAVVLLGFGCTAQPTRSINSANSNVPLIRTGGKVPYEIVVETSDPGSRIEVDNEYIGTSPLTVILYGDSDGTFHGLGDGYTTFRAFPVRPGQYVQTKRFLNGAQAFMFGQQDRIPRRLYFDLNQKNEDLQIIGPK